MTAEQEERTRAWIQALRSGQYIQGKGALKILAKEGRKVICRHCALGVAVELYCLANPLKTQEAKISGGSTVISFEHTDGVFLVGTLPSKVVEWYGLYNGNGSPRTSHGVPICYMNDRLGYSHSRIADILEADLNGGRSYFART